MDEIELSPQQIIKQNEDPIIEKPPNATSDNQEKVSFFRLFAAADKIDCMLMFIGSIASCLQGASIPVFYVLFGSLLNSLGSLSLDPPRFSSEVSKVHHRVSL